MTDKNSSENSDSKKNEEAKDEGKNQEKKGRIIPEVEKKDRVTLPEMRVDFDADKKLTEE